MTTEEIINNEQRWLGSGTKGYIGYEYIKSKGEKVLSEMYRIMRTDHS